MDPGDTVIFRDGVYRGSSYMINPPSGLNGTASQPIIVSSETDGGVEIDGEGARLPVRLGDNDYLVIEGFNLHNSSGAVVVVSTPSDYNLFRRIVAWDARDMNHHVFSISGGTGNVCEDCAGFGVARKTFEFYRQTDGTCRRCWGRWEGSTNQGPKMTFSLWYNGTGTVCENCIMTWDNGSMPSSYYLHHNGSHLGGSSRNGCSSVDQPYGTVSRDRIDDGTQARARVYGSIFYVSGQSSSLYNCFDASDVVGISNENDVRLSNVVAYVDPSNSSWDSKRPFYLGGGASSPYNLSITDASSIGVRSDSIGSQWVQTDVEHAQSVGGLGDSIYEGDGAHVCYRYQDGVETNQELWPWPMQQRILDATTAASASGHTHGMTVCSSSSCGIQTVNDPHAIADVMGDIESIFGSIPAACSDGSGGGPGPPPPSPTNLARSDIR